MKTFCLNGILRYAFVIISIVFYLFLSSFKFQDSINYLTDSPFKKIEYQDSDNVYRCQGAGSSSTENIAQEKAMLDARTRLAKALTKSFKNSFSNKINVKITLTDIRKLKEENFENEENEYICWVIIEVNKAEIFKNMLIENLKTITDNKKYNAFFAKFEKEMKQQKNKTY